LLPRLAGAPAIAQTMTDVPGLPVFAAMRSGVTNPLLS